MKTAIITGCNKGIGYGLLKYLAGKEHDKWKILAAIRNIEDHNIKKIN
jgi:NAD(P)-dependent dehydrogenase (short-subunit alcohol dehydrogenase family)